MNVVTSLKPHYCCLLLLFIYLLSLCKIIVVTLTRSCFSPSGCTFWGKKPWSQTRKVLWQVGMLLGAPVVISLIAGIAIPVIIVGIPIYMGRKVQVTNHYLMGGKNYFKCFFHTFLLDLLNLYSTLKRKCQITFEDIMHILCVRTLW